MFQKSLVIFIFILYNINHLIDIAFIEIKLRNSKQRLLFKCNGN